MNDLEWLATRVGISLLGGQPPFDVGGGGAGAVVEPTHITHARNVSGPVISVVGWPTGRHHSVIKAAEARLAAETGAGEVWLSVDGALDANAILADIVAVRQAVTAPTLLGVFVSGPGASATAAAAEHAGADLVAVSASGALPETALPISVVGVAPSLEAVIAALDAGASRVFTSGPFRAVSAG
ncbi:hypothetical protein [Corynebacterium sp. LK2510]|uniref:hypothetical protein n=1 Tax=Corynebacterium sp. LK2510 TaxID=3110472 RepID=UPI0034CED0B2